jgi:hypothetical protein
LPVASTHLIVGKERNKYKLDSPWSQSPVLAIKLISGQFPDLFIDVFLPVFNEKGASIQRIAIMLFLSPPPFFTRS